MCQPILTISHIGSGAVIGANAVVVNDIEAHAIVAGVPAKRIK